MTDFAAAAGWIVAAMLAGLWWVDRRWQANAAAQLRRMLADADARNHELERLYGWYQKEYNALRRMIRR